jgi:hypothetical protein
MLDGASADMRHRHTQFHIVKDRASHFRTNEWETL